MATSKKWHERLTGSLEEKRQYKQYRARVQELPGSYREVHEGLERYLMYRGGLTKGDELLEMLEDLLALTQQAATARTPIGEVIGEDPVEFAEDFLSNYTDSQWINKERQRLNRAVERALAEENAEEPR